MYVHKKLLPHATAVAAADHLQPRHGGARILSPQLSPPDYSTKGRKSAKKLVERVSLLRAVRLCLRRARTAAAQKGGQQQQWRRYLGC